MSKAYLKKILVLLTVQQEEMFNKCFPCGTEKMTPNQCKSAIGLVERTITGLNKECQRLRDIEKQYKEFETVSDKALIALRLEMDDVIKDLHHTQEQLRLANHTIASGNLQDSFEIQERLDKLDKLEAAGVDNWEGYDYAMNEEF